MLVRLGRLFTVLLLWLIAVAIGIGNLIGGYWLSDQAYEAGLWPVGALIRIELLLVLLALVSSFVALPIFAIGVLITNDD